MHTYTHTHTHTHMPIHTYIVQNRAKIVQSKPSTRRAAVTMGCNLQTFTAKALFSLKGMQLTCRAGAAPQHSQRLWGRKIYRSCQKHKSLSWYHGMTLSLVAICQVLRSWQD